LQRASFFLENSASIICSLLFSYQLIFFVIFGRDIFSSKVIKVKASKINYVGDDLFSDEFERDGLCEVKYSEEFAQEPIFIGFKAFSISSS
jgi:hypothetical protein